MGGRVQYCFDSFDGYNKIQDATGCTTNACLCRTDTLGNAEGILATKALSQCSDYQDQNTAISTLLSNCSAEGYTRLIAPTIVSSTSAWSITPTATVTAFITQYVNVRTPASVNLRPLISLDKALAALFVILVSYRGMF